jgi:hypothetical protein
MFDEKQTRYRDAGASFPVILNVFSAVWRLSLSGAILRTEWHLLKVSFMIETVESIETNGRFELLRTHFSDFKNRIWWEAV